MLEFRQPIKLVSPIGDCIAIYVESGGNLNDDVWCCAMLEDGQLRHFVSSQLKVWHNGTFGIKKATDETDK